ncbi:IdgA domain protein [Aspergillus sp. HF37]|nr:IdgA domain protein [Aspergillus sp. HF37]
MFVSRAAARARAAPFRRKPALHSIKSYASLAQNKFVNVSDEVRDAVATGKPVVALESTIYTHGFPFPDNVALATLLESVVRLHGGIPATVGVLNGVARVGLSPNELIELASTAEKSSALKVSRRDLGYICGLGLNGRHLHGGTTVSGTMLLAHLAGIRVFGTGGLGGVHRGGELSMDISADLTELGRTPVTVISSGCKSFLDIPRTLEYLETAGVCTGTFADGRQGPVDFPAFFTRDSGVKSPRTIKDEAEAAAIIHAQSQIPVSSGIHFANPVPLEQSISKEEMDQVIEQAIHQADAEGYHGSDNTPFVLAKIKQLSGGKSVAANRALIESNVKRATKVAVELAKFEQPGLRHMPTGFARTDQPGSVAEPKAKEELAQLDKADVLVAGSLAIDLSCDYAPFGNESTRIIPVSHTSNPAVVGQSLGGVGHNVAVASNVVGDDLSGRAALSALQKEGIPTAGIQVLPASSASTAQYVAVNDTKRDLLVAMAGMGIMELPEHELDFDGFWEPMISRAKPEWVVVDANWSPGVLAKWAAIARKHGARVAFEPVSTAKSCRLFSSGKAAIGPSDPVPDNAVSLAAPNRAELAAMHTTAREAGLFDSSGWWNIIDGMRMPSSGARERLAAVTSASLVDEGIPQQSLQLLPFIPCIVTKLGAQGVLLTQLLRPGDPRLTSSDSAPYIVSHASPGHELVGGVYMRLFPAAGVLAQEEIVSVNAAGDTLLGAVITGLARSGRQVEEMIPAAQEASLRTLKSAGGVSRDIAGLV